MGRIDGLDKITNEISRENLKIFSVESTIQENQLKWYGHLSRMKLNQR